MSRSFWVSSVALLLVLAPAASAYDTDGSRKLKGPVDVEVRAKVSKTDDEQAPVQVYVHEEDLPGGKIRVEAVTGEAGPIQLERFVSESVPEPVKPGEYWLGLGCSQARGALRAQLQLPEGLGLVVEKVVPESPAAKAEIQQYDVILKAGDRPLKTVQDLIDAVQAAKGKELSIDLIRRAESKEITVTPVKVPAELRRSSPWERPAEEAREVYRKLLEQLKHSEADDATKRALKYLERLQADEAFKGPLRWKFLGPGTILPRGAWPRPPLPENMSITITKHADEPAQIKVRQGDQQWEVHEGELEKLPEKVRKHVEQMLGHVSGGPADRLFHRFDFAPDWTATPPPEARPGGSPGGRLEKRLEDMNRQIDRLRKSIDELREKRPRLRKAPGEDPDQV